MSNTFNSTYKKKDVEILDDLVKAYNQGTMSALIGAGFSFNVSKQYKGWGSLLADAYTFVYEDEIEREYYEYTKRVEEQNNGKSGDDVVNMLSKDDYINKRIEKEDLLQLVSKYIEKKGYREAIDGYIEQRIPYAMKIEERKFELHNSNGKVEDINEYSFVVHRQLLNCKRFNNIYTTNYDNLLEFTVQNFSDSKTCKYNGAPICCDTNLSNYISSQNIIKIHGSLRMNPKVPFGFDNDSNLNYIIAQEDYDTYMQKHEAFAYLMRIAMLSGTFCLIGFSGVDPNYISWLNWMKDIINKKDDNKPKVFLIDTNPDYNKNENKDETYCRDLYNKNHHVAILHLFDEEVQEELYQIIQKEGLSKHNKDKGKSIKELLFSLLEYIEDSESWGWEHKKNKESNESNNDEEYILGRNYYEGRIVAKDYNLAFLHLNLSKSDDAKALLAECYLYGQGTETNLSKAIKLCKPISKIPSSVLTDIGNCYFYGTKGAQKNKAEAAKWFEKAANKGNAYAMNKLAAIYYFGNGVDKDINNAIKWFEKAASKKYARAMYNLGHIYFTKMDHNKAIEWFEKAANKGHADAMCSLGYFYFLKGNLCEAIEWFKNAAYKGNTDAMRNLGIIYISGNGVEKDPGEAIKWFSKAIDKGDVTAMNMLGMIYINGNGVDKNLDKAIEQFSKAAETGDAGAMNALGMIYINGNGGDKDPNKAIEWFTKAAKNGDIFAMVILAWIYQKGDEVNKDMNKAIEWYDRAKEKGDDSFFATMLMINKNIDGIYEDMEKAIKWFFISEEPGEAGAYKGLACVYAGHEQYEEALPLINKALELSPDDANYIDTLAMIYQGLGRYDEAMEQFENALKIAEEEKDEELINGIQDHIQALKDQMEE